MYAKYDRSRMKDAHTVCPANFVGLPAKVVQLTAFFLKKKMIFVQLLCQPSAGQHHMVSGLRLLMFTNLKQINSNCDYEWVVEG